MSRMADTLFGLIPVDSTGQQWIVRDLQLVNWGGYDGGPHRVRFASSATLLSGTSGSGKSTMLDAYIALLMPHTTPFNGASNGGVVGRPRGKDQRNVISYARGKLDESRHEGVVRERVLRGDGEDTWSAVAMTWADQAGELFTALRAYYVPAGAQRTEDILSVRAIVPDAFDLAALEPAARQRLSRGALTALGLTHFDTDKEFTARLYSTLGIGAAGGGAKAVGLLARIQAGQQITTVDALYKAMVLEEPETLAVADEAVDHFDDLTSTREQMLTARRQVQVLAPIRDQRAGIDAATDRLVTIDAVGSVSHAGSVAERWHDERRRELLVALEAATRRRHKDAERRHIEARAQHAAAAEELDRARKELWAAGGKDVDTAETALVAARTRSAETERARRRLDEDLELLGARVRTAADFERQLTASRQALATAEEHRKAGRDRLYAAHDRQRRARAELDRLTAERDGLGRRRGNIPENLHQARVALAHGAGMTPEELPFVAELVEVRTEHEPWREAFNLALGGFATTLLVDEERLGAFRSVIDGVVIRERLHYDGVPTGLPDDVARDPRTMAGRLDIKPGPFAGWLAGRLADAFSHVCVERADELGRHRRALTRAGQASDGHRGAHGGHGRTNLLGFTNARRLAQLDNELAAAEAELVAATEALLGAELAADASDERLAAHRRMVDVAWDRVDTDAAAAEVERCEAQLAELTAGDVDLAALRRRVTTFDGRASAMHAELTRAADAERRAAQDWERAADEGDAVQRRIDGSQSVLGAEPAAYLDGLLAGALTTAGAPPREGAGFRDALPEDPHEALTAFDGAARTLDRARAAERERAETAVRTGTDALQQVFERFLDLWPDPNLGTDPQAAYADFERILTALETQKLHELEQRWLASLTRLSGNDLTDLDRAIGRALREIRERIEPVNAILAGLPFADDQHRLRIDLQEIRSAVVQRFRRDLRQVRELLAGDAAEGELEARYARMRSVIDRVRRTSPDFAELVDVRRHVRVSAEKIDLDGRHVALYDHIGEKSGGESQELVAFIVGAALRYQLGDASADRPRYAPVLLDEALIKADARFAGRAVGAWRGLGFQLIIAAPLDKVSALEPHVDAVYEIVKTADGRSRALALVPVP